MKLVLASALAVTVAGAAYAQSRPKTPPPPPPQQQGAPQGPGLLFPCRSEKETCFVGSVKDGKLLVLFTNEPKAEESIGKPLAASAGEGGAALDLAASENRIVMVTGSYDPKAGLTKAEVVDVASPLVGFAIKASLGGGGEDGPPGAPPPKAASKKR